MIFPFFDLQYILHKITILCLYLRNLIYKPKKIIIKLANFYVDTEKTICYNKSCDKRICGCSLVVELQPSKLIVWVRFPSSAPNEKVPDRVLFLFLIMGIEGDR